MLSLATQKRKQKKFKIYIFLSASASLFIFYIFGPNDWMLDLVSYRFVSKCDFHPNKKIGTEGKKAAHSY